MSQPRKPKGSPNSAGGQYDTNHTTAPNTLPALDNQPDIPMGQDNYADRLAREIADYHTYDPGMDDAAILSSIAHRHPDSALRGYAWLQRITQGDATAQDLTGKQRRDVTRCLADRYGATPHELDEHLRRMGCEQTYKDMVAAGQLPATTHAAPTPVRPQPDIYSSNPVDRETGRMMNQLMEAMDHGHRYTVTRIAHTNPHATVRGRALRSMLAYGETTPQQLTVRQQHDVARSLYDEYAATNPDEFTQKLEHTHTSMAFQHMLDAGEVMDPTSARRTLDAPTALNILTMASNSPQTAQRAVRDFMEHPDPHVQTQARRLARHLTQR